MDLIYGTDERTCCGIRRTPKSAPDDRLRGAIWGQLVGDAACLGSHWIYDLGELARTYPGGVEGFEAPLKGHYHHGKVPGDQTHYGDAALLMLRSVAERGRFEAADFGGRFMELMGSPDYGGYRDQATRETLENRRRFLADRPGDSFDFQQGGNDDQPATATRLAPVVAAHFRDERLLDVVAAATRVCQNSGRAVAYMKCHALVLAGLFDGRDLVAALRSAGEAVVRADPVYGPEIRRKIREAVDAVHFSVTTATSRFGQSCPLIFSFPAAIHAAVKYGDDFAEAVLSTARAGGDSAGRAAMVGAWLGAALGIGGIPEDWRRRLTAHDAIEGDVERLVRQLEP
jgi:ADP-ribosyl-[dinitrogen reductase] hydrolase